MSENEGKTEENGKVVKLAKQYIKIVDFHADHMTGYSHSSGTISYDSIPVANPRVDKNLHHSAVQCLKQPPRPPYICNIKKFNDNLGLMRKNEIDLEAFKNIRREKFARSSGMTSETVNSATWGEVEKTVDRWIDSSLKSLEKPKNPEDKKVITQIRIEIPKVRGEPYTINRKTMNAETRSKLENQVNGNNKVKDYFQVASNSTGTF